jgi:hypothetical protein
MSTFDSGKESLHDLLNDIQAGNVQLPDFQRDWTWDDGRIRSLLASVSLSYPIGAVLMMAAGEAGLRFTPCLLKGVVSPGPKSAHRLILDGQQRLTSLYLALHTDKPVETKDAKRHPIRRWYYLDIKGALDPNTDREDAIVSVPEDRVQKGFGPDVRLDVSTLEKECAAHFLPLSVIFDVAALTTWQMAYLKAHNYDPQVLDLWNRVVAEIILRFQQYQIPVITLRLDTPKEAVCQVFERVNTGGMPLTVFDLVTATFAADNFRLRADWADRQRQLKPHRQLAALASSDFLTAATLLASGEASRQHGPAVSCRRRDVLGLPLETYKDVAGRITGGFKKAAHLLEREHVFDWRDMPYPTQLVPLAAICAALGDRFDSDKTKEMMARWYWCGVLGELYGSTIESRFARDLPEVLAWIDGGPEPDTITECNFSASRLLSLRSRLSAAYKGISALLMRQGCRDFVSGDTIELQTYFEVRVDIHHVFPRAFCAQLGIRSELANCIINKTPLSKRTNHMISDHPPSLYLGCLCSGHGIDPQRMNEILGSHLIDAVALRADDFKAFFEARRDALLRLIEKATGRPVYHDEAAAVTEFTTMAGAEEDVVDEDEEGVA